MISVYKSKECCSGCTACRFACPVSAIDMIQDDEGFCILTLFKKNASIVANVEKYAILKKVMTTSKVINKKYWQ